VTYTIPAGTPKSVKAAAFGRELSLALVTRDIPMKEAARVVGVGRTAIDHYRTGNVLPKTATARALAELLDWPKLAEIIASARTFLCERPGCGRTYRHEGGGPRRYCTQACQRQAEAQRTASKRLRQAGQSNDGRKRAAAIAQLRSAARIADERARVAEDAIAAMCRSCEPMGLCRTATCELRLVSPFPLVTRALAEPRTATQIRVEVARRPEVVAARVAGTLRRWERPGERERQSERTTAMHATRTPEEKAAIVAKSKAAYPAERRSVVSTRMHAERRERAS
jgi:DNA-binding XRE family transcriptional regulator